VRRATHSARRAPRLREMLVEALTVETALTPIGGAAGDSRSNRASIRQRDRTIAVDLAARIWAPRVNCHGTPAGSLSRRGGADQHIGRIGRCPYSLVTLSRSAQAPGGSGSV
jgi:hypothetical protein